MASLTIRKLDDRTYRHLKDRAARDGVSMEEEARRILARAVAPPGRLGYLFLKTFGAMRGGDLETPPRRAARAADARLAGPGGRWSSSTPTWWQRS